MKQVNTFDDILGGQKLIAYMKETAANGTVPHALMLVGEEGSDPVCAASPACRWQQARTRIL